MKFRTLGQAVVLGTLTASSALVIMHHTVIGRDPAAGLRPTAHITHAAYTLSTVLVAGPFVWMYDRPLGMLSENATVA